MDQETIEELTEKNIGTYLYYLAIPVFFIFFLINLYVPFYEISDFDLSLMISVITFLFGFLVTISFRMLLNRVSTLKNYFALETGRLISLYKLSERLGSKFKESVKESIDNYTVNTLKDYTSYNVGRESFYSLYDSLSFVEVKTDMQKRLLTSYLFLLGEFSVARQGLEYLTRRSLVWALKFTDYILAIILIILLFFNRGTPFTNWLFIILSTVVVFIILIIEDYESLKIGGYSYNIGNSEQIFDLIGVRRYYPSSILGMVKLDVGEVYRIGFFDKKLGKERVINMRYSPSKGLFKIKKRNL